MKKTNYSFSKCVLFVTIDIIILGNFLSINFLKGRGTMSNIYINNKSLLIFLFTKLFISDKLSIIDNKMVLVINLCKNY